MPDAETSKAKRAPARRAPITKRTVDAAKRESEAYFIWDDDCKAPLTSVKGFGLKVTPAGSKVYVYHYRLARAGKADQTPPRKIKIGRHGALTPDQARDIAAGHAGQVAKGIDPRQAEADAHAAKDEAKRLIEERAQLEGKLTFAKQVDVWLDEYAADHRDRTVGQARSIVDLYLRPALADKPLPHITRTDLQPIIDAVPATSRANRLAVYAYASIFFRWAMERGAIADNPVKAMAKPKAPEARDRVLSDDELATVWKATGKLSAAYGAFYRLLILTGQRREEVAGMKWPELDRAAAVWTIPADRAKNGKAHIVPLVPAVIAELDGLTLAKQVKDKVEEPDATKWPKAGPVLTTDSATSIASYSKAKQAMDKAAAETRGTKAKPVPLPAWRTHDLRRTLATGLQRLGVRFEVTEAVLNHVSGAKGGVAGIYQRHDWKEEKRTALEAWARHVAGILKPTDTGNVVPIAVIRMAS